MLLSTLHAVLSLLALSSSCYAAPLARKTPASPPAEKVKMAERALDGTKATAWIPVDKVRGVNLGGLFIAEPWMMPDSWAELGCTGYDDEWTCNEANGLDVMQPRWEKHWSTFYSMRDFNLMKRFGLNTVRIPLGYWSVDALVGSKDYFAKGKMKYVKQVVKWAKQAGLYVILDLHGAPGSQTVAQSFTGHTVPYAKFFTSHNYNRAYEALKNWTIAAHTDPDFSTVRVIQVVNEPLQDSSTDVTRVFYPGAQQAIRAAEASLGVSCSGSNASCLTIQFMDDWWGSGHPSSYIDTSDRVAYDDHNYAQWIVPESQRTREGYLRYVCTNSRPTDMYPLITGEWSLSTIGGGELDEGSEGSTQFFRDFFAASVVAAEKGAGQIFWSWKTELQSNLWGYYDGVRAGYIPARMQNVNTSACDPYL